MNFGGSMEKYRKMGCTLNMRSALPIIKMPMAIISMARVIGLSVRYEPSHPSNAPSRVYATSLEIRKSKMGNAEFERTDAFPL